MSATAFETTSLLARDLPAPAPRWSGFPPYNFVGGHNDPVEIPADALADAAASVIRREGSKLAMYNLAHGPQGYETLRDFVADKLRSHRSIDCMRDDILITSGSGQGIDIISRLFLEPGDTVLIEEYCYAGAVGKLKRMGMNVVGIPLDAHGIRIDALAEILDDLRVRSVRPKFIYTIPTIQNPTGSILPLDRRHQLVALAREHGVLVFEDECYADLVWSGDSPPALYALDPGCTVHIGSFSKTLAPALRVGYAVAPWPILSRMIACKGDGGTGAVDQMVVAEYFSRNFDSHVQRLTGVLHEKRDTMIDAMKQHFGTVAELWEPAGGIFLWLKLPDSVDVRQLIKPAADAGIAFNPGPEWACDSEAAKSHLRLCFGLPSKQQIREGVAAFARVCFEQTGIPAVSANVRRA
ncbi:MAG TPA: PLP-dependent aminotransferase family protein [Acetobacteraceae bacterium]|jgi:2-aminoadipate transaminase|nr:PLP-dependent aminotransferase family protein [Acetobacteraceae bacterium]